MKIFRMFRPHFVTKKSLQKGKPRTPCLEVLVHMAEYEAFGHTALLPALRVSHGVCHAMFGTLTGSARRMRQELKSKSGWFALWQG